MLALVPSGPANELVSRLRRQLELKHAELQEAKWVIQTMDDAGVALNAKLRGREVWASHPKLKPTAAAGNTCGAQCRSVDDMPLRVHRRSDLWH